MVSREDRGSFIAVLLGEEEELEGTAARDSTHRLSLSFLICELRLTIREFIRDSCLRFYSCKDKRLPWWLSGKESACQCKRCRFDPCVRKIP